MKKLLIGTSALVAAATVAGAAQAADPIKLSVGGYGSVVVGYADQKGSFLRVDRDAVTPGRQTVETTGVDVKGDNEVHFKGSTKLDNGLTVSVKYEWEAGGRSQADASDEYNITVGGAFGTIIMGADDNALVMIAKGAPVVGGRLFNGGMDEGDLISGNYVLRPGSVSVVNATYVNTGGDSETISYVSPAFAGFTFGATYMPDATRSTGGDNPMQPNSAPTGFNGVADPVTGAVTATGTANAYANGRSVDAYGVGAAYNGEFSGVGIGLEGGWLTADHIAFDEYNEYQVGGTISYAGFALGAAARWIDKDTGALVNSDRTDLAWEVGASYKTGPYGVSLSYLDSYVDNGTGMDDDRAQVIQLAGQYNMGPGVDLVAGIGYVDFENGVANGAATPSIDKNSGFVVASGLYLSF